MIFQLGIEGTIIVAQCSLPILGDLQSTVPSGHKCVPARPIGLTEARVSSVALGLSIKNSQDRGTKGIFCPSIGHLNTLFRLPACAAP